ncbi:MAG: hypothetical protein HOO67_07420 [Candidatus Peribacteraceae bacterium]|nr:hypothetical protein [Candidatus Peribacteraceae bacterium]
MAINETLVLMRARALDEFGTICDERSLALESAVSEDIIELAQKIMNAFRALWEIAQTTPGLRSILVNRRTAYSLFNERIGIQTQLLGVKSPVFTGDFDCMTIPPEQRSDVTTIRERIERAMNA